jgi:hypothetical protein
MFFRFEKFHQFLATTGISRNGVYRHGRTGRQDTSVHQGLGEANETSRVATRVGNALGLFQFGTLLLGQFCNEARNVKGVSETLILSTISVDQSVNITFDDKKKQERTWKSIVPVCIDTKGSRRINNNRSVVTRLNPRGRF